MVTSIKFTDTLGVDPKYAPVPAIRSLPDWYKASPEYMDGERVIKDGNTPHTIKKCMPVFDAMTAGYIIPTYVDIQVTTQDGASWYEWPQHNAIAFHPIGQAPTHPDQNGMPFPKWVNPWAIRTAHGTSVLILPPLHNPNGIFTIMPGMVDTDTYYAPISFPFTLVNKGWEGIIPAGTPMAQVIPFRRDDWRMSMGSQKDIQAQSAVSVRLRSLWFNSYKRQFWSRKRYT